MSKEFCSLHLAFPVAQKSGFTRRHPSPPCRGSYRTSAHQNQRSNSHTIHAGPKLTCSIIGRGSPEKVIRDVDGAGYWSAVFDGRLSDSSPGTAATMAAVNPDF